MVMADSGVGFLGQPSDVVIAIKAIMDCNGFYRSRSHVRTPAKTRPEFSASPKQPGMDAKVVGPVRRTASKLFVG